eukprot:6041835-Pyramimonas_sp.AAC.1
MLLEVSVLLGGRIFVVAQPQAMAPSFCRRPVVPGASPPAACVDGARCDFSERLVLVVNVARLT